MPLHYDCIAFTAAECDAIVALAEAERSVAGTVWSGSDYRLNPAARSVATVYCSRRADTAWVYDRLDALFAEAAERLGLRVGPMTEELQIMTYTIGSHFRMWHSDAGTDLGAARILSVSVELSDPADHDGGDLEIAPSAMGRRTLPQGAARFFPSRALHHVTPVTRGVRRSLVNWAGAAA